MGEAVSEQALGVCWVSIGLGQLTYKPVGGGYRDIRTVTLSSAQLAVQSPTSFSLEWAAVGALGVEMASSLILEADGISEAAQWQSACAVHQSGGHEHTLVRPAEHGGVARQLQFVFTAKVPEIAVEVLDSSGRDSDDALTARGAARHSVRHSHRLHDIHMLLRVGGGLGECAARSARARRRTRGATRESGGWSSNER